MSDGTPTPSETSTASDQITLAVSDVGGVDHAEVTLSQGVTTFAGANASNRSSLLQALNEVLGGTMGSIRRGAANEKCHVELTIANDTYTRTLTQQDDCVSRHGNPYAETITLVDLYVSLLERNKIRQLIETGDSDTIDSELANLLMAPVDLDTIQQEIEQRQQREHEIEEQLETISAAKEELRGLEERQQTKQRELDKLEEEIAVKRDEIDDLDINRKKAEQAEKQLDRLQAAQEEYQDIKTQIEHKERAIEEIRERLAERQDEIERIEERIEEISLPERDALQTLDERQRGVRHVASLLDNLAEVSRTLVKSNSAVDLPDDFYADVNKDVVAALDPDSQTITCPVCDTPVKRKTIHERVDTLAASAAEYYDRAAEIEEQRAELRSQRQRREELQQERDELNNEIRQLEERLERETRHIEDLEDTREVKQTEIDELREQVEKMREQRSQELEELYDEIAELQGERANTEAELERVESQIADHESTIADEEALRQELTNLKDAIKEHRAHITSLEERVQDAAASHMEELVDRLDYDRIEGIHLNRVPSDDPAAFSEFRLVVSRRRKDGVVIEEENFDTLSESERSLVGLVVALSGYVAHDVADEVPFLLLDSIEEFDSERIDRILGYVRDEVDVRYIVAALLPEDAAEIGVADEEITADTLA